MVNNFQGSGSIPTVLISVDVQRRRGDKLGTTFTVRSPKNL